MTSATVDQDFILQKMTDTRLYTGNVTAMIRVVVLAAALLVASTACVASADKLIDLLNSLAQQELPTIRDALRNDLPQSYGACNEDTPTPCTPYGPYPGAELYYEHKSWAYKVWVYWISGLKSANLTAAEFSTPAPGQVTLSVLGYFRILPVHIHIDECFTFDACSLLWDNWSGCCGLDKNFAVNVTMTCHDTPPYVLAPKVSGLYLDKLEVTESIGPLSINLEDITGTVTNYVYKALGEYMTEKKFISYNGQNVTLLEYINDVSNSTTGGAAIPCPQ